MKLEAELLKIGTGLLLMILIYVKADSLDY